MKTWRKARNEKLLRALTDPEATPLPGGPHRPAGVPDVLRPERAGSTPIAEIKTCAGGLPAPQIMDVMDVMKGSKMIPRERLRVLGSRITTTQQCVCEWRCCAPRSMSPCPGLNEAFNGPAPFSQRSALFLKQDAGTFWRWSCTVNKELRGEHERSAKGSKRDVNERQLKR